MAVERIAPPDVPAALDRLQRPGDTNWGDYLVHLTKRALALPGGHLKRIVWDEAGGYPQHSRGFMQISVRPYVQGYGCDGTTDNNIHLIANTVCRQLGIDYGEAMARAYPDEASQAARQQWLASLEADDALRGETLLPPAINSDTLVLVLSDLYQINNRSLVCELVPLFEEAGFDVGDWYLREDALRARWPGVHDAPLHDGFALTDGDGATYSIGIEERMTPAGRDEEGTELHAPLFQARLERSDGARWEYQESFAPAKRRVEGPDGHCIEIDDPAVAKLAACAVVAECLVRGVNWDLWRSCEPAYGSGAYIQEDCEYDRLIEERQHAFSPL